MIGQNDDEYDSIGELSPLEQTKINGTPLSVLIKQAADLKSAQSASLRKNFDRLPTYLQNSIFSNCEVIEARNKPFESRLSDAMKFKNMGNLEVREGKYYESIAYYEMSISVFRWINNMNPNWKTEGIKDEFLQEEYFRSTNELERLKCHELLVRLYTNLAIVYLKIGYFRQAVLSCNDALELDPVCVKALYLRSKARLGPKSGGSAEEILAMKDLKTARKIDPSNDTIMKELRRLHSGRAQIKNKFKSMFKGTFQSQTNRSVHGKMTNSNSNSNPCKQVSSMKNKMSMPTKRKNLIRHLILIAGLTRLLALFIKSICISKGNKV